MASAAVGAGIGLLSNLIGGFMGQNAQDWQRNALVDSLNKLEQYYGQNQQLGFNYLNPQRDALLALTSRLSPWLYGDNEGNTGQLAAQSERLAQFGGEITPDALSQFIRSYGGNPAFEEHLNNLSSLQGVANTLYGTAEGILSRGGKDDRYGQIYDRLMDIGMGRGAALDEMQNVGSGLLSQRGQTNLTQGTQDRALDTLNRNGSNAASQLLMGLGGGLAGRGAELANREALLPIDFAASMARDQAARQSYKAAENFRRRALAKGGGPGALSSGSQNRALLEFEDMLLGNEADALQNSLTQQQALQLQQMGQGFSGASQGLGAAGQSQSLATQLQQVLGALGLDAGQLETSRMGLGGNLADAFNRLKLGGLSATQSPVNAEYGNLFNAGGLMNQTYGQNQGMYDTMLRSMLGGGNLGLAAGQGYFDNRGQNLSQQGQWLQAQIAPFLQALGEMGNTGRSYSSLSGTALAGIPGLFNSAPSGSALGSTLSNMGQGMGSAISQWMPRGRSGGANDLADYGATGGR